MSNLIEQNQEDMGACEWQGWTGGVMPVSCDEVLYRLRHNPDLVLGPTRPELLRWDHGRTPQSADDPNRRASDIIAYMVVAAPEYQTRSRTVGFLREGGESSPLPQRAQKVISGKRHTSSDLEGR